MESKEERIEKIKKEIKKLILEGKLDEAIIKTIETQCIETEEEV